MQINSVSPTSAYVRWNEVQPISQNGFIIAYELKYEPLETFGGQLVTEYTNSSDSAVLEITLTGLEEYVEYNVSLRAYTAVGSGPFSPEITLLTPEDGKQKLCGKNPIYYGKHLPLQCI